ncbi:tetratricopeptide repeat protein [Catenuloplanes atrovinosus]|uniref:Tetratricopeptide (TPR) repeat protein n=1 Tax=Catenuloplanes atrovinosus TaxID=137266 RepID=A0AAE3YNV6_9ACTN|nr:tetratricopeptide repeat protein [Catenuloplanes atrovinosus]MDR7275544.1 tetratricopeptide (TPR) repeat protein [Catenuloplanes atrovinosus]
MDPAAAFVSLPDPARATGLDDLVERLRLLKIWAGDPSYETIKERVNAAWTAAGRPPAELARRSTVADCFRPGRRRLNTELVIEVVRALHPDTGYVAQWRQVLRVVGGESEASAQVRVQDRLPPDPAGFTGRDAELELLRRAARDGDTVVISAIEGMPGVGKTQLALRAAHLLLREVPYHRVLFVHLRGFHPDPAQPPADPAAVLDGFLRLLGVPGRDVPHDLDGRAAAYRARLAGTRTLVVLDDVATAAQVRPLLPDTPGCLALVTSRRRLGALGPATRLAVDVFTPGEATAYLRDAAPGTPTGTDPDAAARIARRCGHLPLALSLVAGHIRGTPGWTLTDHADRLDQRHRERRLDSGVELALGLSYQNLAPELRLLLRMAALHPGQDLDAYAAAALTGTGLAAARAGLERLRDDHLLQQPAPGRYAFHDLVRAHTVTRAQDEDRPPDRRAALTRLFDHYLAAASAAMDTLHPAEAHLRPAAPPVMTPLPELSDPDTALDWLNAEQPTLVAVAAHTATHGWHSHTVRLSRTLFRYLTGTHLADALTMHGHASDAARRDGDTLGQAHALTDLGGVHWRLGRPDAAARHFEEALALFARTGDADGQARALTSLGIVTDRGGRPADATGLFERALALFQLAGNRIGEARTLNNLANVEVRLGRDESAAGHWERAIRLFREAGDRGGEANALNGLGDLDVLAGRYDAGAARFQRALALYWQIGSRTGEANILDSLGTLHTRLGRPEQAVDLHRLALTMYRETGDRYGEARALNGLGEAARAAGDRAEARDRHAEALAIADDIGSPDQRARARAGLE